MTKRALIVGSQTPPLSGVNRDVESIDLLLTQLEFETTLCVQEKAKRQNILDGYEKLIADSRAGDAALLFYSGHGGLAVNPNYQPMAEASQLSPRYYQFIVPFDIDESTEDDFRGITSLELSMLLARLTDKTKNVTVILDCCHAARMSRDLSLMPKALPKPWFVGVEAHLEKLSSQGISAAQLDIESNPDAIRLVAAGVNESAYEYTNEAGIRTGILTESFLLAMEDVEGLQVSWHNLGTRVRERVLSVVPFQRAEIEGPSDRILFELETVERTGVLPVIFRYSEPKLQGGRLMGVHVGDIYTIAPLGIEKPRQGNTIAEATVTEVSGGLASIDIKFMPGHETIPAAANAFPVSAVLPKQAVAVLAQDTKQGDQLRAAINASERLRVAEGEETDGLLARVEVANSQIHLRDRANGYALIEAKPFSAESVQATIHNLNQHARAQTLINLRSGEGANALEAAYDIEFGRVVDGETQPLSRADDVLSVGDRVYLRVRNKSPETIYVSVFDIGVASKISLMTRSEPSGVELKANEDYMLGYREGTGLRGVKLGWASGVPDDGPRTESVIVILTDVPQDLRPLTGGGMRSFDEKLSSLQQMVDQIGLGGARDMIDDEETPDVRYAVKRIDFLLSPSPAPDLDEGTFLIDRRPPQSLLVLAPKSAEEPPSQVAVRLKELIVHSNRALFSTEIRIDNMIVTGAIDEDSDSFYQVETARFPKIKDGDRLPLENMLVYHGPVAHFVDMAVWVSRDQKDSLTLAEMIKSEMNSADFKVATTAVAALAVPAPQAALVVGAVGGAATLIQIGTRLLLQAAGKSIGLYRTSHLAFEQFGVGRHPSNGLMRAQDFSFSYEVLAVD